jgi:hypothetical protein
VITACLAKSCCTDFLQEKQGYMDTDIEDYTVVENTFLDIKHSHCVWVTDTASLHSG